MAYHYNVNDRNISPFYFRDSNHSPIQPDGFYNNDTWLPSHYHGTLRSEIEANRRIDSIRLSTRSYLKYAYRSFAAMSVSFQIGWVSLLLGVMAPIGIANEARHTHIQSRLDIWLLTGFNSSVVRSSCSQADSAISIRVADILRMELSGSREVGHAAETFCGLLSSSPQRTRHGHQFGYHESIIGRQPRNAIRR